MVNSSFSDGYPIDREDIIVFKPKEETLYDGRVIDNKIYISTRSIDLGKRETVDTLLHEELHRISKKDDATVAFERFIIHELVKTLQLLNNVAL